jgi:hypothetical protein
MFSYKNMNELSSKLVIDIIKSRNLTTDPNIKTVSSTFLILPIAILSFISCLLLSISIRLTPSAWENTRIKFIFYLLVLDALTNAATLLPTGYYKNNELFCTVQGTLIQIFTLSSILWTGCIAIAKYFDETKIRFVGVRFYAALLSVVGISTITATVPLEHKNYDFGSGWCWFLTDDYGYRFGFYYSMAWAVMIEIVVLHCYKYRELSKITSEDRRKAFAIYRWYPTVLLICCIQLSIFRIMQNGVVDESNPEFQAFGIFASQIFRLLGFFNSIVYVMADGVREQLEQSWKKVAKYIACKCCYKRHVSLQQNTVDTMSEV